MQIPPGRIRGNEQGDALQTVQLLTKNVASVPELFFENADQSIGTLEGKLTKHVGSYKNE